jgi:hypothetical protein
VVEKGACCSIADGANIYIWNSPWIPSMPSFKPRPNVHLLELLELFVVDLLLNSSRSWNVDLLHDLFYPLTIQNILSIHIPQIISKDKWTWVPSPSGTFSVKSACEVSMPSSSRSSPLSSVDWQALWGLKLQARLKHLLCKIARDILPCRANIGRFVVVEDPLAWVCPFCKGPLETLCHIFLDCSFARILWRSDPWPITTSFFSSRPISDWILAVIYPLDRLAIPLAETRKFQLFAALALDFIWFFRNKLIHEAIQPVPSKAIQQIKASSFNMA